MATPPSPSLKELASIINAQTSKISDFVEKNGLPPISFGVDGMRDRGFLGNPELIVANMALIQAATDLLQLALGPQDYLTNVGLTLSTDMVVLDALNAYNLYDAVPLDGSITYAELSAKCNFPEGRLRRILKHAFVNGIFWGPTPDTVAHTGTSAEFIREELRFAYMG